MNDDQVKKNDDQVKKSSGQVRSIYDQSVTGKVVGAFTEEAKLKATTSEELMGVDNSLLGYREGKKSKWRTARPEWNPIQYATMGQRYTSKNGNVYRWDDIATLMQEGEDEGTSWFMQVMGFPGAVVEFGYDHTIGLMEDQPDPLPEGTSDFYGIVRDAGGPDDVDRRVQRYIDDMEDWEAIFAQGEIAGVAKAFGMGAADPIELAITGLTLGTNKIAKGKVPFLDNVADAAKFHKALRRLRRIQNSGARLTPQQAALLAPIMSKAPSTYKKLRRVVLPALFEGGVSYAIESAVDDQLTSGDLLKVAGTAAMFAGSLSFAGRKANQFYGSANRLYNNLVDESMSERLEGIAEEAGVPFKISTREEEIATALHLADIDAVDFEVAFKDLMQQVQHDEDFIKSMQTAGVIKFTQPASVDLSSSTNARMLAWFLFQRNLMPEGGTGVDFASTVSDLLAHNKRVIHFELSELFEEAGVPMGVRGAVSSKINPEDAKNSERYLEAVYRSLDEEDFLETYEIDLPEDQIVTPEDGSPPVTTKTVNVFTDPNSEYFGLDEAKVKNRAGRIRDRIFDYEGHHLGLAERVEHYFPRTGRIAEYVNDPDRQANFKDRFVAYVTKKQPDIDPAEADKLAEEALQSIVKGTNKRVVMPEWTVDGDGQIVRPHEVDGVSVPGEARERNIDIPLYVMRDFYQDGNVNMFRSTLPRQSNVFAAQELLKLNPKGSAESLPKVIDEADLPEVPEGQPPVDYNEDYHDIQLGRVARRSGVEDVTSFIEEHKPLVDDVRRQDSEIKTLKEENEQLKQTNRDLKVEEGAIVDTAESRAEQAVDQYSEGLDLFFELEELQGVSKDDVSSQLSKLQPRLEKLLKDQQRELDSGELRAVTDLDYGKEKLIDEKTEITKGVNKKNIKAQEKLSKNLESKKSEEFVLSKLVQIFQYRTGDKSVLTFGPEGSFVVIDPSGYKAKDFEADLNWLANEYFPGQADSLSKMKAFIKNDPEKLLAKYSEQLTKKIGERVEVQKTFDDFKPEEYSPEVSARVGEIDSLLGQIESQQELPVHRRKAWNSSKANLRAAKIKDLRQSIKVLKDFLEAPTSVNLDAADLQNIQVKVKGQTGRVSLRDAVAIVSEAFNEQQSINLADLEYNAKTILEDAVVTRNTSSRRAGDEIDEASGVVPEGEGIDLNIEAKKYETVEEFVESQGVSVYHGGDKEIKNIDEINFKDGVFYTLKRTDAELKEIAGALREDSFYSYDDLSKMPAEAFGKNVSEFVVKFENPKIIDAKGKSWSEFTDEGMSDWTNKIVSETGEVHDGIIIKNINEGFSAEGTLGAQAGLVDDYIVLKKSAIKTKSQLTDIWNKAQGEASGVTPENPIDEGVRHNQRERLLNIIKMRDNTLRRQITELERRDANAQVRNTLGFSVKKKEISLRDRNNLAIEANKEFVNSSLSLGIINDGGSYRFTDQGWGGRIKREFEELIDNAEGDEKVRLEEEMELTAYLVGRMRDNMLGMGQTSSIDALRKGNAMGAQWLTLPNISKNSSMDLANLMVKRKGNEVLVSLAKSLSEAIKEKLPVGQELNETTIVKIHEASVLELMDRDSGTSSRAFMLSEEGGSAYTKEAPKGTDITGQAWKRVSGFKYVQPFLRGVIARVYEDHILGIGEKLYWGEDLSVDDLRDLKKFSLNPDRAKKIYAEWTRTHSPENHISPNGQLKLFVNVEDMDPDLRNDFERAVNTATSSVHLEPRFEDTMVTKPNEGGSVNAELEMVVNTIQGFGHAAARKWRMPGTQLLHELSQDPLSKRTSEYALGTAAAVATMVAIESLYYTAQEYALEQVGTEQAMGKKSERSVGQLLLDTFLKSGYGGGPARVIETFRYLPDISKSDSSYEKYTLEQSLKATAFGIGGPGLAGSISLGMDVFSISKDTVKQLTSHKKSKREFATDLRRQGLRGSLTPAHIMLVEMLDIAGAFTKEEIISPHIELKTPSLRVRED